jgi:Zn-dependent alcohol dehydrogenase
MTLTDGAELSRAAVGLLGCDVMAGLGAVINTDSVGRGDCLGVIGCGGVGDAAAPGWSARRRSSRGTPTTVNS